MNANNNLIIEQYIVSVEPLAKKKKKTGICISSKLSMSTKQRSINDYLGGIFHDFQYQL